MIFSSNFFPCIDYFSLLIHEDNIKINIGEQYRKQSYHTRAYILGPHKVESLNVPVKKYKNHTIVKDIRVDYSEKWNERIIKTIRNCYTNSPFYFYFEDDLNQLLNKKYSFLVDLNHDSLTLCLKLLKINKTICQEEFGHYEYKNQFLSFNAKNRLEMGEWIPYRQVFGKQFEPNLSVLDLIFTKGMGSIEVLEAKNAEKIN